VEGERKQTGRRALLTAAGLIAAGGVPAAISALGGKPSGSRQRAWWVKAVDRPTMGQKTSQFKRFSGDNIFVIYQQLKAQRDGAGSFERNRLPRPNAWQGGCGRVSLASVCPTTS